MAVNVTFAPLLAKRASSRRESFAVPFQAGLRPIDIVRGEGFSEADAEAILVLVNDAQADLDTPIHDGDRLEFMIGISGGACPCSSPSSPR
jgi:molybdopterin converting factor small subunit